jgi:putative membrane protein
MSMIVFRYLHFLGVVFWLGSALAAALAAAYGPKADGGMAHALRKVTVRITTPSMVIAFAGGLGMLIPRFVDVYAKQGWMHAKLTLLLILAGATGVLTGRLRRWAAGQNVSQQTFARLAWVIGLIGVLIVTLAIFRPFGG